MYLKWKKNQRMKKQWNQCAHERQCERGGEPAMNQLT